jgi:hypothetical protein
VSFLGCTAHESKSSLIVALYSLSPAFPSHFPFHMAVIGWRGAMVFIDESRYSAVLTVVHHVARSRDAYETDCGSTAYSVGTV